MAKKTASLLILATFAAVSWSQAAEFSLELKKITPAEALACPGDGLSAGLVAARPKRLTNEPKAVSKNPLYGVVPIGGKALAFRLDESKGAGKGYDRLILDVNGNSDLTDDPVAEGMRRENSAAAPDLMLFGPVEAPGDLRVGPWRPSFCATAEYRADEILLFSHGKESVGTLRLTAGWYLEATVELDGSKEKIGFVDGNCSLRLGDAPGVDVTETGEGTAKYVAIGQGDSVLRDRNGSGRFKFDACESESEPFTRLIGIGRNVYELGLAGDLRSVRLEPSRLPLGQLAIGNEGNRIRTLTLVRKALSGKGWELFTPALTDGKAVVPEGTYHPCRFVVVATGSGGSAAMSRAWKQDTEGELNVAAGKTATLRCGAPLQLRIEAERRAGPSSSREARPTQQVDINVGVFGVGGERYIIHARGKDLGIKADPPRFRIFDEQGGEIAAGQLEYG